MEVLLMIVLAGWLDLRRRRRLRPYERLVVELLTVGLELDIVESSLDGDAPVLVLRRVAPEGIGEMIWVALIVDEGTVGASRLHRLAALAAERDAVRAMVFARGLLGVPPVRLEELGLELVDHDALVELARRYQPELTRPAGSAKAPPEAPPASR